MKRRRRAVRATARASKWLRTRNSRRYYYLIHYIDASMGSGQRYNSVRLVSGDEPLVLRSRCELRLVSKK